MKYTKINDGVEAKVQNDQLYVRYTNIHGGILEQGGRINRVIAVPYPNTIEKAQKENEYGISDIDRAIEQDNCNGARLVQAGRIIR